MRLDILAIRGLAPSEPSQGWGHDGIVAYEEDCVALLNYLSSYATTDEGIGKTRHHLYTLAYTLRLTDSHGGSHARYDRRQPGAGQGSIRPSSHCADSDASRRSVSPLTEGG